MGSSFYRFMKESKKGEETWSLILVSKLKRLVAHLDRPLSNCGSRAGPDDLWRFLPTQAMMQFDERKTNFGELKETS